MTSHTISVIGLGYVGLPVAVSFAERGFNVIGFDISQTGLTNFHMAMIRPMK